MKYLLLFLLCFSCDCPDEKDLGIKIHQIGTVTTNGETCKIEEVVRSKTCLCDGDRHCDEPLVRRIVCPSGNNGQSTVTDDGTKFHREVLE